MQRMQRGTAARSISSLERRLITYCAAPLAGHLFVNEYPKSGGSWVGEMLARVLGVPFPRNRRASWRRCILHGHLIRGTPAKTILVWRDGRDVMVSWYYHCLVPNDRENQKLVSLTRSVTGISDVDNIRDNLPRFLKYAFRECEHPPFNWAQFVRFWSDNRRVVHTSYEAFKRDPEAELGRVVYELTGQRPEWRVVREAAEECSFERMSGRHGGSANSASFLRKGIIGDWMNHFSRESREIFDKYAGTELIKLGYEVNSRWVSGP